MEKERIEKIINSTFECVELIKEFNSLTDLDNKQLDKLKRAKEHINLILNRLWVTTELTESQKSEIESCLK